MLSSTGGKSRDNVPLARGVYGTSSVGHENGVIWCDTPCVPYIKLIAAHKAANTWVLIREGDTRCVSGTTR